MTNEQLYLAVGVPIIINMIFNGFTYLALDRRITNEVASLKDLWRAELRRVEEVLDARLKHIER